MTAPPPATEAPARPTRPGRAALVLVTLASFLAGAVVALAIALLGGGRRPALPRIDSGPAALPDITVEMLDGSPIRLAELAATHRLLIIDFWASWCGPCVLSMPKLDDLHRDLAGEGLAIIGVNAEERPEQVKRFLATHPVGFPIALDPEGDLTRRMGVSNLPSTFIYDRRGRLVDAFVGFDPNLRRRIDELL